MKYKAKAHSKVQHFTGEMKNEVSGFQGEMEQFVRKFAHLADMERHFSLPVEVEKTLSGIMDLFACAGIQPQDTFQVACGKLHTLHRTESTRLEAKIKRGLLALCQRSLGLDGWVCPDILDTQKFPIQATIVHRECQISIMYDGIDELGFGKDQWILCIDSKHMGARTKVTCAYGDIDWRAVESLIKDNYNANQV